MVRVRFAPSPTGPLHVGGVRTALYNYLYARKNKGKFVLRIEDTDQSRFVEGAEKYIHESLVWLDIRPDEGPEKGGEFGPYRQSERREIYKKYVEQLIRNEKAYYAFDTPEELELMKEKLSRDGIVKPQYNYITRQSMKNSLTLSSDKVNELLKLGTPHVIRLKVPESSEIRFRDLIRDYVHVSTDTIDDKILLKSDGLPTYHLANVVDDHEMKITHVIRGEEWLPSAPLHVLLYQFFGWEESMPEFAHLPLILKPEGSGKLSKRDGDKHGFPVFPITWKDQESGEESAGFRENGYLPETMINFLALLGWNPGNDQEIFSKYELENIFSLERVNKAGAKFDIEKAKWLNQQYLKNQTPEFLGEYLNRDLQTTGVEINRDLGTINRIAYEFRERITFPKELVEKSWYFFRRPEQYDEKVIEKKWNTEAEQVLKEYSGILRSHSDSMNAETAKNLLTEILDKQNMGMGKIMQLLRVVVTGEGTGIDLMTTIEILGSDEVSGRIDGFIKKIVGNR